MYSCPMHPGIVREQPGMCPECGMNLMPAREKRKEHKGHGAGSFLKKFYITLIATIPILIYSELPEALFGWNAPAFPGSEYLPVVLGSFVFFYGGWIFLAGAVRELRARLPGMMTLIGLAIVTAYAWSLYAIVIGEHPLFWELATLVAIMLLGHWMEMKTVQGARGALQELAKLLPDTAEVITQKETKTVPISALKEGDTVLVKPGSRIPADGEITEGYSDIDESIVTGESNPVAKGEGDEVIAGSVNGDGSLHVNVAKIGEGTFLAGIMRLVADAESSKSRLQMLSDKAAFLLTLVAITSGTATLLIWLALGQEVAFAISRLVAVFVIACPHALGLAVPLVASISTNMAASHGFLVRKRISLEAARTIDIVLFDKTGTLTKGEFGVEAVLPSSHSSKERVLQLASSVNKNSEHSIAKAIVHETEQRNISYSEAKEFHRIPGKGARALVEGVEVLVGSRSLLNERKIVPGKEHEKNIEEYSLQGKTLIYVIAGRKLEGVMALGDLVREESHKTVQALHAQGIRVGMITGDSEHVASHVAKKLGIDEYFASVLPHEKVEKVKALQSKGLKVAMVGDGVNDAPALAQADLGIAIGAGTNVAIESAGIVLVRNNPSDIPQIIRLSKLTFKKMMQNLFWATGYNVVALPLAAGVLFHKGIVLEPAVAAILMSASTVIVAVNAMLLRREKLARV